MCLKEGITRTQVEAFDLARGWEIARIRSDNGSCYISREFRGVLEEHGLGHQQIKPHCPEENGIVDPVVAGSSPVGVAWAVFKLRNDLWSFSRASFLTWDDDSNYAEYTGLHWQAAAVGSDPFRACRCNSRRIIERAK